MFLQHNNSASGAFPIPDPEDKQLALANEKRVEIHSKTPKLYIAGLPLAVCTKGAPATYSKTDGSAPSAAIQRPCCTGETLKHRS